MCYKEKKKKEQKEEEAIVPLHSQNPPAPRRGEGACGLPDSFVILLQGVAEPV